MPLFAYRARTAAGRPERGLVDAESLRGAWQELRARGVFPIDLAATVEGDAGERVPAAELAAATRELATLVAAGVPIADALDGAAAEAGVPALARALTVVRARVREGTALADALAACPRVFPPLYRELVRAGEASGALGAVLDRLARDGAAAAARRARLRAALAYPTVMVAMTSLVLVFLLVWVVPEVARLFAETGTALPLATRTLVAAAAIVRATWWMWAAVAALGALAVRRWYATSAGRRVLDGLVLRVPLAGRTAGVLATGRVARALATVLANGVPLDRALDLAGATAGNVRVAEAIATVRDDVRRGEPLAPALGRHGVFPPTLCRLVATGERTGALAAAFDRAAEAHEARADRTLTAATALVEPALVILVGAAVLALVLAVLVPILTLDPLGGAR
jgi:general secretion pathway protein F